MYATKGSLERHINSYCNINSDNKNENNNLKKASKIINDNRLQCRHCNKNFTRNSSLKRHLNNRCTEKKQKNINDINNDNKVYLSILTYVNKMENDITKLIEQNDKLIDENKKLKSDIILLTNTQINKFDNNKLLPSTIYKHKSFYDNNLITKFDYKRVIYIGYVGIIDGEHIFKYGKTKDIFSRDVVKHRKDYGFFDLIFVYECLNNEIVEKKFERELIARNIHRKKTINNTSRVELFTLSSDANIDKVKKIMKTIIKCYPLDRNVIISDHEYQMTKEKNNMIKLSIEYKKLIIRKQGALKL